MAVAMTTFGSTLSDLQKLTNDDRALDYSRANFQDDINARRLSDFLKARSEENRTKAQRDAEAARLLDAQQARAQQIAADKELQGMAGANALEIAKLQSASRQMDPRMFQVASDIEAENNEQQDRINRIRQLSAQRKMALGEKGRIEADKSWTRSLSGVLDFGAPNQGIINRSVDPRWKELTDMIANLDAEAKSLGGLVANDGGYNIPVVTPLKTPAMFNANPVAPAATPTPVVPQSGPLPFISTDSPPAMRPTAPVRRFRVTPDNQFLPQ